MTVAYQELEIAIVLGRVVQGEGSHLQSVRERLITVCVQQHKIVVIIGAIQLPAPRIRFRLLRAGYNGIPVHELATTS